ncbi:MAG: putative rane protein [Frankiales bacterium]|nr:putative rane protein [Frankiales bacterium]
MKISNEFTVSVPVAAAWEVLTDLERIAPCLPGTQLTGRDGDSYQGKVKVKVGPVVTEFSGVATFVEKDDSAYRAVIDAKGKDARGGGNANATITAQLRAEGAQTVVTVETDLKISGKLAQFGSGMIAEVSNKLLGQFVEELEKQVVGAPAPATAETTAPAAAAPPPPPPSLEAVDLTELAGGAVAKRLAPVAVVLLLLVLLYAVRRKR